MTEVVRPVPVAQRERPRSVRFAFVLWIVAAVLTAPTTMITIVVLPGERSVFGVVCVAVGIIVVSALVPWAVWGFSRGGPVARAVLTGISVFWVLSLATELITLSSDRSGAAVAFVLVLETVRAGAGVLASMLAWDVPSRSYFSCYDGNAARPEVVAVPGGLWFAGITAVAAQLSIVFWRNLSEVDWADQAVGGPAVFPLVGSGAVLCLIPAWASLERQFRYGRQWARVTLTVLGAAFLLVELLVIRNAFTADGVVIYGVLGVVQLIATGAAIVSSYPRRLDAFFRSARESRPSWPMAGRTSP